MMVDGGDVGERTTPSLMRLAWQVYNIRHAIFSIRCAGLDVEVVSSDGERVVLSVPRELWVKVLRPDPPTGG